ncbi:MAG TPA: endonuclease [Pseudohongiella sp.]|nr:endonuclease [Pseudohongiella sp.]
MRVSRNVFLLLVLSLLCAACGYYEAPQNFDQARQALRDYVYYDRNDDGDFYCGCDWEWTTNTGGRVDLRSCGYQVRMQETRAQRIEWEHVVPASAFGQPRQCWRNGGRENCNRTDPEFNRMEANLHNLVPAVGEVNGDRSNYRFADIPGDPTQYGACRFEVDTRQRLAEPADAVKGQIARIYFYMYDRYQLPLSVEEQQLYLRWHQQFPVSDWELERDRRVARLMGHNNPYVTGEKQWILTAQPQADGGSIRGNRNSKIYHLPEGCPGYNQISDANRVLFRTEQEAREAGYRRAGNCR